MIGLAKVESTLGNATPTSDGGPFDERELSNARQHPLVSDSVALFALEGKDDLGRPDEKVRPPSNAGLRVLRMGGPLRRTCRGARPAQGTQDTPHRSRPEPTALSRLVDHRTIDRNMDEAIADPACEFARVVTGGEAHFRLKDRIDKQGSDYARRCPPAGGLLTVNVPVVATHR